MYQPALKEHLVRKLYQLKLVERRPMTKLINEAVEQYLSAKQTTNKMEEQNEQKRKMGNRT